MKNQALFSSKNRSKKVKCRLLQFLLGALRVVYGNERIRGPYFWLSIYNGVFLDCPDLLVSYI